MIISICAKRADERVGERRAPAWAPACTCVRVCARACVCRHVLIRSYAPTRRDAMFAPLLPSLRCAFTPLCDSHPRPRNFTSTIASQRLSENKRTWKKITIYFSS